jgi:hypothetical protein
LGVHEHPVKVGED